MDTPVVLPRDPRVQIRLDYLADCEEAINELFRRARASDGDSPAFLEFLDSTRRFSNLSVFNAMLVNIQRPGSVAVGSRREWASIGRQVKPCTPPLLILWPFGPVAYVYEYADTEGEEIVGAQANVLFATGEPPPRSLEQLIASADKYEVRVECDRRHGPLSAGFSHAAVSQRGSIDDGVKPRLAWRVVINQALDKPSAFATLAHELGHIYCGHLGEGPNGAWPDRRALGKAECELEAEAVSYILCLRNGLTTRSHDYLATHIDSADIEQLSMFAIYEAANRIESRTSRSAKRGPTQAIEVVTFPPLAVPTEVRPSEAVAAGIS